MESYGSTAKTIRADQRPRLSCRSGEPLRFSLTSAFDGLDGVIHAAAYYPTDPRPWAEERQLAQAQMLSFIQACRTSQIGKAVYVGGSIALDGGSESTVVDETRVYETAPPLKNGYVQSKWVMDHEAAQAADDGVPMTIAIPSMTLGPYDFGPSTGQVITRVAQEQLAGYTNGRRNVIAARLRLAARAILALAPSLEQKRRSPSEPNLCASVLSTSRWHYDSSARRPICSRRPTTASLPAALASPPERAFGSATRSTS